MLGMEKFTERKGKELLLMLSANSGQHSAVFIGETKIWDRIHI